MSIYSLGLPSSGEDVYNYSNVVNNHEAKDAYQHFQRGIFKLRMIAIDSVNQADNGDSFGEQINPSFERL